jgi:hypothetical protein
MIIDHNRSGSTRLILDQCPIQLGEILFSGRLARDFTESGLRQGDLSHFTPAIHLVMRKRV